MRKLIDIKIKDAKMIPEIKMVPVKIYDKETGYKAITTVGTNDTISIVTNAYQPVAHKDVYNEVKKLDKFKINNAMVLKGGRTLMLEITDIKPQEIEIFPGDSVIRQVRVFNSYDGTRALSVSSFGMRLICKNGAVAPGLVDRYKKIHTFKDIQISEISKYVELGMEAWANSKEVLVRASKTIVVVEDVLGKYKLLSGKYMEIVKTTVDKTADKGKDTVYNIWNAYTNVITHSVSEKTRMSKVVNLQRNVNKLFNLVPAKTR